MRKLNNHDLAQQRQKDIYGADKIFILEKLAFINKVLEQQQMKNRKLTKEEFEFVLFNFPNTQNGNGFLKERSTTNLFSSHLVLEKTENIINVTAIENNLISYLKKLKTQQQYKKLSAEEEIAKFNSFQSKTLLEYLSLQKSRNILIKLYVLDEMTNATVDDISDEKIKYYQEDFNNYLFQSYFDHLKYYSLNIRHFDRINISSTILKNNILFVSEYDVINLEFFYTLLQQYKQDVDILENYIDYLKDVELMIINQNVLYMFANKKYLELTIHDRKIIGDFIANNWNTFTLLSCLKYAIVSKESKSKEYISNLLYDLYNSNFLSSWYDNTSYPLLEHIYAKLKII